MRRALVALLAAGMGILSFDALRAYALTGHPLIDGVIPQATILPRPWLAMLWAVVIDAAVAAGILGVKDDRHDWRAWLMLLLALAATLGFQVFALSPFVARAVPPVGLALAILVLDLGPARPRRRESAPTPAPARLHAWLRSWDLPERAMSQPPLAQVTELPTERAMSLGRPNVLTPAQQRRVESWVGEGRTNVSQMARDLGVSERVRKHQLAPLVRDLRATQNGDRPKEPVG